ncbi:DUF917 domain-containing protein [Brevibacterium sp. 50QC2O2]|uniref:DUF917 domain-containing protein n=1 Tax=Brevibacterium sp. 50QC2O2 TaxID=2968459 RepID=UPI00211C50EB|nr:DUF917 domain-containing protein [Brevibacterium sp. 50QC2O2]MCQ9388481.1 DUF917 domain-containing protein [Brevibacterium sp. 50QC2O2]
MAHSTRTGPGDTAHLKYLPATGIAAADCLPIAKGAAILGTGGGGDPHIGRLLAEAALREHGPVEVVALTDVPDDACVFPVGMMGAPTVMVEKLAAVGQFAEAVRTLAAYKGIVPTHIACIEAGGVNSLIPVAAAAELGLPLIDGDGMGRAFPELPMVLPTIFGVTCAPMAMSDEKGNSIVFEPADNIWAERLARTATVEMGCSTIISQYSMTGVQVKQSFVPNTLSLCHELGTGLIAARAAAGSGAPGVVDRLGGVVLGAGKIVDVERRTTAGFARGRATVDLSSDTTITLDFQNENIIATVGDEIRATAPDLIICLDSDTGEAVTTEALRFGTRVTVIVAPADPRWHSEPALDLVAPRCFGYDLDPVRARFPATHNFAAGQPGTSATSDFEGDI